MEIIGLLGALVTGALGIVLPVVIGRWNSREKTELEQIESVLDKIESKNKELQLALKETLAENAPIGANSIELVEDVSGILMKDSESVVFQIANEGTDFVQGLVSGYHEQALSQAKIQFWFSIVAAALGFVLILFVAFVSTGQGQLESWLRIVPGVIIEVVAALFFSQAEKTRQRATELYDRLRNDNQLIAAEKLLSKIEDQRIKSVAQAQIALHMAGLQQSEIDVSKLTSMSAEKG